MDPIKLNWTKICENLKTEFTLTDTSFETWIKPLEYYKTLDNTVYIIIQSDQTLQFNYITNKFTNCFKVIISEVIGSNYDVKFVLKNEVEDNAVSNNVTYPSNTSQSNNVINSGNLNPKYKFEDFVVGSNNKLAYSACLAVAETPGEVYNPLYIYGDPGLGKTHLMHSIGHMILERDPNKKVIYVTSEEFTNEVIESIRFGDASSMSKLRDKYRTVDVLMVDDIQFIIGKDSTQEEFFHTFNALHEAHKQIVISSDKPPKEIQNLEERFMTRFLWGLTVDIKNPDYETRMAILRKNAEKLEFPVSDEIIQYIATNIVSNIRELEGALNKVAAYVKLTRTNNPTLEIAQEALKDIINTEKKIINSKDIIDTVSEVFDIKSSDIMSPKRNAEFVLPRQVVMYLCYDLLSMSYTSIAKMLNKKDHTTIIHGCNKIQDDLHTDENLKMRIEEIKKKLS
ncbi:MAG: chromosomal replication initiator protein DnaA [Lachnospiraceae bacterium]|nr:chromosomal replication initiator protein DnaA [Lachnospiraceae bacterium]MBR1650737.1 chromosomal replication initiator protein DnaA [Lachnospiraceae bacterium]